MEAPELDLTTAIKLGSLVVHLQEWNGGRGHTLDVETAKGLANDPAVTAWLAAFPAALLPVKRGSDAGRVDPKLPREWVPEDG